MIKYLIYLVIKCSLDQVPPIRGLQSFLDLSFFLLLKDGWWTLVFGEYHFLIRFLLKMNVPGRWNDGYEVIILSFDNDCDPQWNQSDFKMVCYVRFFCISRELFCVQPRLGMAWKSCLEGMPCNSNLYLYLNIEVVIGLVQSSPFLRSQVVL